MVAWSKDVHPDTGELYIDLGEDHEGYTRYVWFAGDMEVYDKADFEAADLMVAAPDLYGAVKGFLEWTENGGPVPPKEQMERALAKAEGREDHHA